MKQPGPWIVMGGALAIGVVVGAAITSAALNDPQTVRSLGPAIQLSSETATPGPATAADSPESADSPLESAVDSVESPTDSPDDPGYVPPVTPSQSGVPAPQAPALRPAPEVAPVPAPQPAPAPAPQPAPQPVDDDSPDSPDDDD